MDPEVIRSSRRTLGLTIERDGSIVLRVPEDCPQSVIDSFIEQKKPWIYRKLAERRLHEQEPPRKEYVSGEGFPYLGRTHALHIVDGKVPLRLYRGYFELDWRLVDRGRDVFILWYRQHAREVIERRVDRYWDRFSRKPSGVRVLDLKYRWGSCSADGVLNFHWKSILAPMTIVDYIVVHEMVHLIEPNHTPKFWDLVGSIIPDYEQRKGWLKVNGRHLDI